MQNNSTNTTEMENHSKICSILQQELVDLNQLLNASIKAYEEEHKESYFYQPHGVTINEHKNTTHHLRHASPQGSPSTNAAGSRFAVPSGSAKKNSGFSLSKLAGAPTGRNNAASTSPGKRATSGASPQGNNRPLFGKTA